MKLVLNRQQKRVIPWRKDEDPSLGFVVESAPGCRENECSSYFLIFHPTFQVADGVVDFFDDGDDFAKPRFEPRLVKILPHGIVKLILALYDCIAEHF